MLGLTHMHHPFYRIGEDNREAPKQDGGQGYSAGEVSYIQLLENGWVWYRLRSLGNGNSELSLVKSSDPNFSFDPVSFSSDDANSERHFGELGLFFVDAPPTDTPDEERGLLAGALRELVEKSDLLRRAKEEEAERTAGWQGVMRFFHASASLKHDIPELEQACIAAREKFMDLCRRANEIVENPSDKKGAPGQEGLRLVSSDKPEITKRSAGKLPEQGSEMLRWIVRQALQGVNDAKSIRTNLEAFKTVEVGKIRTDGNGLDDVVKQNIEGLIEEAKRQGVPVASGDQVEKVFEALASVKQ